MDCEIPNKLALRAEKFGFTPREIQILFLRGCGRSMKETAGVLKISVHTVNFHSRNIAIKLQGSRVAEWLYKNFLA